MRFAVLLSLYWLHIWLSFVSLTSLLFALGSLALSAAAVKPAEPLKAVFANKAGDEIAARKVSDASCTVVSLSTKSHS